MSSFVCTDDVIMTNEPFEVLDRALSDAAMQSEHLTRMIAQVQRYHTPEANRRSATPTSGWVERRRGERRIPQRATAGRRELSDRRLPIPERIREWQDELEQIIERNVKLYELKRTFLG